MNFRVESQCFFKFLSCLVISSIEHFIPETTVKHQIFLRQGSSHFALYLHFFLYFFIESISEAITRSGGTGSSRDGNFDNDRLLGVVLVVIEPLLYFLE